MPLLMDKLASNVDGSSLVSIPPAATPVFLANLDRPDARLLEFAITPTTNLAGSEFVHLAHS